MVVADRSGLVHIIDKALQVESFLAYDSGRVTHMKQLRQRNILVTVGVSFHVSRLRSIVLSIFVLAKERVDCAENRPYGSI